MAKIVGELVWSYNIFRNLHKFDREIIHDAIEEGNFVLKDGCIIANGKKIELISITYDYLVDQIVALERYPHLAKRVETFEGARRIWANYVYANKANDEYLRKYPTYGLFAPTYRRFIEGSEDLEILVAGASCPFTVEQVMNLTSVYPANVTVADKSKVLIELVSESGLDVRTKLCNFGDRCETDRLGYFDVILCNGIFQGNTRTGEIYRIVENLVQISYQGVIITQATYDGKEETIEEVKECFSKELPIIKIADIGDALRFSDMPSMQELTQQTYKGVRKSQSSFYVLFRK